MPGLERVQPQTIAILGAGAWGTTLARLAACNGHQVRLWSRHSSVSLAETIAGARLIVSAVSMAGVRPTLERLQSLTLPADVLFVSATKGLTLKQDDLFQVQTASQLWQATFSQHAVVVLSGPNLSEEIQAGLPAAAVAASQNAMAAAAVQTVFSSQNFRVYTNPDCRGVELAGTLKNVMAIAAGTCDALGLGINAKAALLTRGLTEMIRIGTLWGGQTETFYGLAGLGDLLATCNSSLSRNYQVGYNLGLGKNLAETMAILAGTAEGINTTRVLVQVAARQNISVPISAQVNRLLNGEITPKAAVAALMLREMKPETNFPNVT